MPLTDEQMKAILAAMEEELLRDQRRLEAEVKEVWDAEDKKRGLSEIPPVAERLM